MMTPSIQYDDNWSSQLWYNRNRMRRQFRIRKEKLQVTLTRVIYPVPPTLRPPCTSLALILELQTAATWAVKTTT